MFGRRGFGYVLDWGEGLNCLVDLARHSLCILLLACWYHGQTLTMAVGLELSIASLFLHDLSILHSHFYPCLFSRSMTLLHLICSFCEMI